MRKFIEGVMGVHGADCGINEGDEDEYGGGTVKPPPTKV